MRKLLYILPVLAITSCGPSAEEIADEQIKAIEKKQNEEVLDEAEKMKGLLEEDLKQAEEVDKAIESSLEDPSEISMPVDGKTELEEFDPSDI